LCAENKGAARRGAWARAGLSYASPYRNFSGTGALGVWVKGDGKGALLNLQLGTPREYMSTLSDHYVTLDFTGWRYVELLMRERDVGEMSNYEWPYGDYYGIYRTPLDVAHISEINLYLNQLPPGDSTEVIVSPIRALPVQPTELKNPSLTVNGQKLSLPVALKSGDFLEIEPAGDCVHYDDKGDLLARIRPAVKADWPVLKSGENAVEFDCEKPIGMSARAEVTVNTAGMPFGTPTSRSSIGWKCLAREYEMPRWITAREDAGHSWEISVRPGETARVELELSGGMDTPILTMNGQAFRFPVTLKAGHKLVCRDQLHWAVFDAKRAQVTEGELVAPLPILQSGSNRISFTCGAPDRALVKLVKVYEP